MRSQCPPGLSLDNLYIPTRVELSLNNNFMGVQEFENYRWGHEDQKTVFRHKAVIEMASRGPVLDLGCGDGLLLALLRKKGIQGEGLDISGEGVAKCRQRGVAAKVFDFASAPLPYGNNTFAMAILTDVLEHLYFPHKLLAESVRVAQECLISVPNFNSLPARVQVLLGKVPENNRPGKGHVFWFTYWNLKSMLDSNGCLIAEMRVNTFWESRVLIGTLLKCLAMRWPSIFALSFVVRIKRKQ